MQSCRTTEMFSQKVQFSEEAFCKAILHTVPCFQLSKHLQQHLAMFTGTNFYMFTSDRILGILLKMCALGL